jgi:phage gp46-like protein
MSDIDIKLEKDSDDIYDISFTNGDFTLVQGFETALQMSIYCERRASESEVPVPKYRRGWWGNITSDIPDFEIGSKLWLLYQSRKTNTTLNFAKTYAYDGLSWLIEDNFLDKIDVNASFINNGLTVNVSLLRSNNVVLTESYELWTNTQPGQL